MRNCTLIDAMTDVTKLALSEIRAEKRRLNLEVAYEQWEVWAKGPDHNGRYMVEIYECSRP